MTLVYFILGTPGSGRRGLVADLVQNGLGPDESAVVLLADGEAADPADAALAGLRNTTVARWRWLAPGFAIPRVTAGTNVFLLADPQAAAVDQIEELKPWLAEQGAQLARVITVVDCGFASARPALDGWFEACIHFSDVVFLTRREGVVNKWLSDFINRFKDRFYPCHFIQLKKGGVENPALVLDPQPRRVSHYFDETEDLSGIEIETDDEDEVGDGEEPEIDPYLARMRGGRRVKEIPDLRDHLPAR